MAELGFELILRFLWAAMLILSTISRRETSERFPRIAFYIALGCALFAGYLAAGLPDHQVWLVYGCLGALVLGSFLYAFVLARAGRILGFLLFALAPLPLWWGQNFGDIYNFVSSGLLLGSIFAGQYLGHWYLTVPNLHIRELQRIVKILFVSLGLKTVEVAWTLWERARYQRLSYATIDDMGRTLGPAGGAELAKLGNSYGAYGLEGEVFLGLGFYGALILVSRLLWGILAPWILAYMIKKTVDIRATQSATGILYALTVMVILGEGAALFLKKALGWNL